MFQLWDTAGQERFQTISHPYWRSSNGLLFCYACNDKDSFERIQYLLKKGEYDERAYKILVATKADEGDRCIDYGEGKSLAAKYEMPYYEVSAKTGQNVNEVFNRFIEQNVKKEDKKVIFVGDFGTGKTSIFNQFLHNEFLNPKGDDIKQDNGFKQINVEDKILKLELWDTADQEKYNSLPRAYFRDIDCCVMVYDITSKESFESLEKWRLELEAKGPETRRVKGQEEYPIFVLGNKIDQEVKREVRGKEAMEWAKRHKYHFYEVSAQENVMIEPVLEEIGKNLDWKSKSEMKGIKLEKKDKKDEKEKSSCFGCF